MTRLNETERILKELRSKSNKIIESQSLEVQTLRMEIENLEQLRQVDRQAGDVIVLEKEALISKMAEQTSYLLRLEEDYMSRCKAIDDITSKFSKELVDKKTSLAASAEKVKECNEGKIFHFCRGLPHNHVMTLDQDHPKSQLRVVPCSVWGPCQWYLTHTIVYIAFGFRENTGDLKFNTIQTKLVKIFKTGRITQTVFCREASCEWL